MINKFKKRERNVRDLNNTSTKKDRKISIFFCDVFYDKIVYQYCKSVLIPDANYQLIYFRFKSKLANCFGLIFIKNLLNE